MGNKLCAPILKKSCRHEEYPWHVRKDSHLLRLWAEVFRVHGDGEYMKWQRVSEDVVPINITCIEDSPNTVFQITAYNRHVEKIFDVRLVQPGTIICPATESFVHWRDSSAQCEWGLNFTTPPDAKRFRDCCMNPAQKFSRKASSANSLRLSPPKRIKENATSVSSPNSPVHHAKKSVSSPYELGCPESQPACNQRTSLEEKKEKSATIPRSVLESEQDAELFKPTGILKPPSTSSVYDNVTLRKPEPKQAVIRKSMPTASSHVSFMVDNLLNDTRPASAIHFTRQFYQHQSHDHENYVGAKGQSRRPVSVNCDSAGKVIVASKSAPENIKMETAFVGDSSTNIQDEEIIESVQRVDRFKVLAPQSIKVGPQTTKMGQGQSSQNQGQGQSQNSQKTSLSDSPEWPSPPEPLTPMTPVTPVCNVDFDSDVLKRMLQSLPVSPEEVDLENDQGFHDDPDLHTHSANKNVILKSQSVKNQNKDLNAVNTSPKIYVSASDSTNEKSLNRSTKQSQAASIVEYELKLRNKCVKDCYTRDSYPDSGIGGMTGDTAGSVWSGESLKPSKGGLEVSSSKNGSGSTGGSSRGSSSSGRHSDLINQLGDGTNVKQFLSSELSDEEDAASDDSIHTMTEAESRISITKQFGAIRKAGWLVVKNWLIHRKRKLELAPKRKWKRYWVCLKGTVLLFFDCSEEGAITENSIPRHILVIEGGVAQAVPEHPKRENIFSLSTAFGDAYLFQAQSPMELENWICALHSACASSFARQHGKDNTLKLMKSELHKLETNIDVDVKMKKMAELQLSVVTDSKSRQAIIRQISQWEENLEKLYIEQYRLRCYAASLQGSELPNPKVPLANASKTTKSTLGRLGIFTVTSFHALVSARKPLVVPNIYGKGQHKGGMLSPKGDGTFKYKARSPVSPTRSPSAEAVYKATDIDEVVADLYKDIPDGASDKSSVEETAIKETLSRIALPNNQTILVGVEKRTTIQDLLDSVCSKRQLNPRDHYVRIKLPNTPHGNYTVPDLLEPIKKMKYESIEVCQKSIFQLELVKSDTDTEFGFAVEAELAENFERDDELCLYVSDVRVGGIASQKGLIVGDEILVVNGKVVSELDMVYIETILHESKSLFITVRSLRTHRPQSSLNCDQADMYINDMVCPPPPSQSRISEQAIGSLIVPAPLVTPDSEQNKQIAKTPDGAPEIQINELVKGADQVTSICREMDNHQPRGQRGQISAKMSSEMHKLRKVIMELIDTERMYVKDLNFLIDHYLEPLKKEGFMTTDNIDHLFGNIQEIVHFQGQFLTSLEEAMQIDGEVLSSHDLTHFKRVLFSIGGSFLFYANHFKVYSSFCASHTRSQKILNPILNEDLKSFLKACNPKQEHSETLESYLIKPIQRILKYPLLLQQLCSLTNKDTDEHYHLSEALKGMEAVAEHINEMQKIYEEYGSVFDELSKMFKDLYPHKQPVDLSVGELQMYGTVEWCNICVSLGKIKKGLDLENIVFVFKTGVVFLCREKCKRRKSKGQSTKGASAETFETIERFRTLIPVQDVQVRGGKLQDMDRHYWWELIHSRCDKEARPERVYEFCNTSADAKSDFLKIIRQTIRESVRKMMLPGAQKSTKKNYIPFGGKRLEGLSANVRTLSKKRGSKKSNDSERHSVDYDDQVNVLATDPAFRNRSKTVGDLNDVSPEEEESDSFLACSEPHISQESKSSCSSTSNLSTSSRNSGSAKLTFASANPLTHSSNSVCCDGSPIWKPRNEANQIHSQKLSPLAGTPPANSNCTSDIVFRKDAKTIILQQPQNYTKYKDTEC